MLVVLPGSSETPPLSLTSEKIKLQVTHSRAITQRRPFMFFVVFGLSRGLGWITERFYGFEFSFCVGLGRLHFSEHPDLLAMVMGDVCGQSLASLTLEIACVIEALLLKTHILQQEQVEEPKDRELPDPIHGLGFGRLLVDSAVWYFVWYFLPPTVQKLVGPSACLEKITLFAVHWIVSKWIPRI
ncbi:uncharacterized protein CDV56_105768 [Aspergillus thermomutatus]|uniref:Uncharacterized protein n=1 Tax=Aspergillus thermomutatus TaxID=41047 RepID=A0A397HKN8_ASPTH|nr:uncharacterized protein CDV56_105768 [Aspergillus thermomutatus]RHZ62548.1 hypothetical protein CDV56_105768 [Aspergillus thermomutatus]